MTKEIRDTVFAISVIITVGVSGVALFVNMLIEGHTDRTHDADCERVLRCLDTGVDRPHCDELYPGCEAPTEDPE